MLISRRDRFYNQAPDLRAKQDRHSIMDRIGGVWEGSVKRYEGNEGETDTVSRPIKNSMDDQNPTNGILGPGRHAFFTEGNEEWMYGLDNGLAMSVGKDSTPVVRAMGERVVVPKESWLIIDAGTDEKEYFCRYNASIE